MCNRNLSKVRCPSAGSDQGIFCSGALWECSGRKRTGGGGQESPPQSCMGTLQDEVSLKPSLPEAGKQGYFSYQPSSSGCFERGNIQVHWLSIIRNLRCPVQFSREAQLQDLRKRSVQGLQESGTGTKWSQLAFGRTLEASATACLSNHQDPCDAQWQFLRKEENMWAGRMTSYCCQSRHWFIPSFYTLIPNIPHSWWSVLLDKEAGWWGIPHPRWGISDPQSQWSYP